MTEREKMLAGEVYDSGDSELRKQSNKAKELIKKYNKLIVEDLEGRNRVLKKILGSCGDNVRVNQPFYVDYGCNITVGDNSIVNMNCTFLDTNKIVIGKCALIAPDVKIYTAYHPMIGKDRFSEKEDGKTLLETMAKPVIIGDYVWIGGGSIILPGVTIGNNVVIGAGSVVTKSITDNVVAYGNPCRVVRKNN